mmetsp:Transcript_31873/g.123704  ORF Transcript_31873/g.123704 Transcript_31873/m.123704 type:complete len:82 (-) Transcript_31873:12-257(-)
MVEGFKFQFRPPTLGNWDSSKAESGAMSFLRTLSIFLSLLPAPAKETGLELRRTIYGNNSRSFFGPAPLLLFVLLLSSAAA